MRESAQRLLTARFTRIPGKDHSKVAGKISKINALLKALHKAALNNKELSRQLHYNITPKVKSTERKAFFHLFDYTGLDEDTANLLSDEHVKVWIHKPADFFVFSEAPVHFREPQDELVSRVLQLKSKDARDRIVYRCYSLALCLNTHWRRRSVEKTVDAICGQGCFPRLSRQYISESTHTLIGDGSRYICLENDLGNGSIFLLGKTIPESSCGPSDMIPIETSADVGRWMRLSKSGANRQSVIEHLRRQGLDSRAAKFAPLRNAVIGFITHQMVRREPAVEVFSGPCSISANTPGLHETCPINLVDPQPSGPEIWGGQFQNWSEPRPDLSHWSNGYQSWSYPDMLPSAGM